MAAGLLGWGQCVSLDRLKGEDIETEKITRKVFIFVSFLYITEMDDVKKCFVRCCVSP